MLVYYFVGDTLKLREVPKASRYQVDVRKLSMARLIASGMVTTLEDVYNG